MTSAITELVVSIFLPPVAKLQRHREANIIPVGMIGSITSVVVDRRYFLPLLIVLPASRSKHLKTTCSFFVFVAHEPTQVQSGTKGPTTSGGRGKWSQTRLRRMGHMAGMRSECEFNV